MRAHRLRTAAVVTALAAGLTIGCEDQSYRDIGSEISLITKRNDLLVAPATERLRRYGRKAMPQIETALHTASETGRLHLVATLRAIGDAEAIPILRHFAVYDLSAEVRKACEDVLGEWAKAAVRDRAVVATAALATVKDLRAKGEAPAIPRPQALPAKPL